MSTDPSPELTLAREALARTEAERDRARAEARLLRQQLRALRAELQAVKPASQVELETLQAALAQAQAQAQAYGQAREQAQDKQRVAELLADKARVRAEQLEQESQHAFLRVIELREQVARAESAVGIERAAAEMLRRELEEARQEATRSVMGVDPATQRRLTQDLSNLGASEDTLVDEPVASPAESGAEDLVAPTSPEVEAPVESSVVPQPEFDLPEGSIWFFEGMAEPEHFLGIVTELAERYLGELLTIGHFQAGEKGVVAVLGPEHSAGDLLYALWREQDRAFAGTGLPLIRVQPTTWCSTHWDQKRRPVAPEMFREWRRRIVDGELERLS